MAFIMIYFHSEKDEDSENPYKDFLNLSEDLLFVYYEEIQFKLELRCHYSLFVRFISRAAIFKP